MATLKALPRGTRIVLVSGPLLLLSLFFTWQDVPVDYGTAGVATRYLDGFDLWGLLLAILVIAGVTLAVVVQTSDENLAESGHHASALLGIGLAVGAIAILKSLTDAGSTLQSYAFVGLAVAFAAGAAMDWASVRRGEHTAVAPRRRGLSSVA